MSQNQSKSIALQELEVLENFLKETPEDEIKEAAIYIFERIKQNVEKIRYTPEEILVTRFAAVLERIKKYLKSPSVDNAGVDLIPIMNDLTAYDVDYNKETIKPLVCVSLTTYNHVNFLKCCLNGILMQKTNFPFKIIIFDDCSTDGTSDIIREYANKYSNIIHDIQPENYYSKDQKLWMKKNVCFYKNHFDCKYWAAIEGDDYWIDPYKLQIQVGFLENNSDFSMCTGGWVINNNLDGQQAIELVTSKNSIGFEYDFVSGCNPHYLMKSLTRLFRTEVIAGSYEISHKYKYFRDIHIAYYALQKGKGYHFQRIFGIYNKHADGIFGGLSIEEQAGINLNVFEEMYLETRDDKLKRFVVGFAQTYINLCLKTGEQRMDFYKIFIKDFPELSTYIEKIIQQNI